MIPHCTEGQTEVSEMAQLVSARVGVWTQAVFRVQAQPLGQASQRPEMGTHPETPLLPQPGLPTSSH